MNTFSGKRAAAKCQIASPPPPASHACRDAVVIRGGSAGAGGSLAIIQRGEATGVRSFMGWRKFTWLERPGGRPSAE